VITWNPQQHGTDYAIIAGTKTPGICEIVGADAPRKWDERQGYALSGAWLIFTGNGLAHFSIKLKLYTKQHWLEWWAFRPVISKRPKPIVQGDQFFVRPKALDIWHPLLDPLGITSIVVESELQPVLTDETGEWTIELKVIQFRAPVGPAAAKPVASKPTPAPDAVEQVIIDKTKILAGLAG
jgi:hypothetical protein